MNFTGATIPAKAGFGFFWPRRKMTRQAETSDDHRTGAAC
jgi:hypothetical protein